MRGLLVWCVVSSLVACRREPDVSDLSITIPGTELSAAARWRELPSCGGKRVHNLIQNAPRVGW